MYESLFNDPEFHIPSIPQPFRPTEDERLRINRGVSAVLRCASGIRSGTSLTGFGGLRHLSAHELNSQGPLIGDMTYEEWSRVMTRQPDVSEKESTDEEDILDDNIFGDGFVSSQRKRT